jgi:hypothetical protein
MLAILNHVLHVSLRSFQSYFRTIGVHCVSTSRLEVGESDGKILALFGGLSLDLWLGSLILSTFLRGRLRKTFRCHCSFLVVKPNALFRT